MMIRIRENFFWIHRAWRRVVFPYTVKGVPYSCPIIIARFLLVSAVMVFFFFSQKHGQLYDNSSRD